jgi:DNA-binding CsgD family transcriptional regulator
LDVQRRFDASCYSEVMTDLELNELRRQLAKFTIGSRRLTPAEQAEALRIARGFFGHKDSALEANLSPETIRIRRKRIYKKLEIHGAIELTSSLLHLALCELAVRHLGTERMRAG